MYLLQIERSSQPAGLAFTQEKDHASSLTKHSGHQFDSLFDFAHHPDHRSWMDRPGRRLIVETDISARHRQIKRPARLGHSLHSLTQLPENLRIVRISIVQIIGQPERHRSGAGQIPAGLRHQRFRSLPGILRTPPAIPVQRHGHMHPSSTRFFDPQDRRIASGTHHRPQSHHVIVLVPDPTPRSSRRRVGNFQQILF